MLNQYTLFNSKAHANVHEMTFIFDNGQQISRLMFNMQ